MNGAFSIIIVCLKESRLISSNKCSLEYKIISVFIFTLCIRAYKTLILLFIIENNVKDLDSCNGLPVLLPAASGMFGRLQHCWILNRETSISVPSRGELFIHTFLASYTLIPKGTFSYFYLYS